MIQRWDESFEGLREFNEGEFVLYEDHMRDIAEKNAIISGHEEATESLLAEIHRQDAEIERLRKALTEIRGYTKSGITYNIADEAVKEDA